ncbi:MAG: hypothetical protein JXA24_00850, partial [Proteobacteria bacterium]|nr:hypothetical protein [Pseudomonadota bacterium]
MSVNGINNYKVNTVSGPIQDDWKAETVDAESAIEDMFETGSTGSSSQGSSALDDYTMGEISGGSYVQQEGAEGAQWLLDFPPTLEEIVMNNETAINYLDLVEKKFIAAIEDLAALKKSYQDALSSGQISADEAKSLTAKLGLIDKASSKAEAQLDKCRELATGRTLTFMDEQRSCKDLNNDKWIGRPYQEGSIYIHEKSNGNIVYLDNTGKPVRLPIIDPDYQAQITTDGSLAVLDPSQVMAMEYRGSTDLILGLTKASLKDNGHEFGCPISLNMPRYFWVKRDPEGVYGEEWALNPSSDNSEFKMELYDQWNGTTQLTPPDISEYMQVSVTDIVLESIALPAHVSGDSQQAVYDQYVTFQHGDDVIARIQITGFQTSDNLPSATMLSNDVNFVAASSVGFELHGDNQVAHVDASKFKSTCRHITPDLASKLGIKSPEDSADLAFDENIGFFTDKDWNIKQWDALDEAWEDGPVPDFDSGSYAYGNYNDRYMSETQFPGDSIPYSSYRTGVFISGVRGHIQGSTQNDVIVTCGANDLSDYEKQHLPIEEQMRTKDDPFYTNYIDSTSGGNDVAIVGGGDNLVNGATFVWVKDSGRKDENYINFPEPDLPEGGRDVYNLPNHKCFFYGKGNGTHYIYNPIDWSETMYGETIEDENEVVPIGEQFEEGFNTDDYYSWTSGTA